MLSYVYMKILESRPRRYDTAIAWLSLGQADRIKRELVARHVHEGDRVLDLGTGTGSLALLAAQKGAKVVGTDVSEGMLAEAKRKAEKSPERNEVRFIEAGVAELDAALAGQRFDLVTASLLMSELSEDEQRYALRQAHELLEPAGRLVIVDETRPANPGLRALYHLVRIPLAVATFALTQTTTSAVTEIEDKVREAGFAIDEVQKRSLDTLIVLTAHRREKCAT